MQLHVLLAAKKITSARSFPIRISQTIGGGATPRARLAIPKELFNILYNPGRHGITPRSDTHGSFEAGIIIVLSASASNKIDFVNGQTNYINFNSRPFGGELARIASIDVEVIVATYEDGSTALIVPPIHAKTFERATLGDSPRTVNAAVDAAFRHVGKESLLPASKETKPKPQERLEPVKPAATPSALTGTVAETAPAPQKEPTPPAATHSQTASASAKLADFNIKDGLGSLTEISDLVMVLNNEVKKFRETNLGDIKFAIAEDGSIRAEASVIAKVTL